MPTAQPFSWTVRFTVAPIWVQDGFSLGNERALDMLARAVGAGSAEELKATVLEAPSPLQISRMQGYHKDHPQAGTIVRDLISDVGGLGATGAVRGALIAARQLLDSVAFVAKEGDSESVIKKIDAALAAIDTRQGEAVEIEA